MRMILGLLFALFTCQAFASGTLQFQPAYNSVNDKTTYLLGLSIYEKLLPTVHYNSWTGFGDALDLEDTSYTSWFVTKHQLDLSVGKYVTVSPGVRGYYKPDMGDFSDKTVQTEVFGKLSVVLW